MLKRWRNDIAEKTAGMTLKEKISYIRTYYWYHFLISISILSLFVLLIGHFLFGRQTPQFYCVLVNQPISSESVENVTRTFAKDTGLKVKRTVVDSNYVFSYGDHIVKGANESTYEKFFLQWRNKEIDAVILPESFYLFCKEMGGAFRSLDENKLENLEGYRDQGSCKAVILGEDYLTGEDLLLAFPDSGRHEETAEDFLKYMVDVRNGKIGGVTYEEIIDR